MLHKIVVCLLFLSFFLLPTTDYQLLTIHADEIEDLQKQIDELSKARESSVKATKPLEGQLDNLKRQLVQIQTSLNSLSLNISKKEKELKVREDKIVKKQLILEERVRAYYIRSYLTSPLLVIFASGGSGDLFRELSYRLNTAREDREIISSVTGEMLDLLAQKEKLEKDKALLGVLQAEVDKNASFLGGEVKKAKDYQAQLTSKIVQLSARQQQILSQRLASLNISRSAASLGACVDDRSIDPGFSPRIAFFTYGVPNRTGLNQYGADGRARAGQNAEAILGAYYANYELKKDYDTGININVSGYGPYNIEEYVKRIYEMPNSFHQEALKAQAIAARSYALAYTNNGQGSICTTEQCQVFKPDPKGGGWEAAVNETKGWVMVSGGSPIKAWYSSTHGGYILSTSELPGWQPTSWTKHALDTTSGSAGGFGDLDSNAYDKHSPWFYCDWGSRPQYNKTAWLKPSEVADIANSLLLVKADSGASEHLYQVDKPNPAGTETWDEEKVKAELRTRGITPYSNVSDISISADFGSGQSNVVNVSGDGPSQSFNAGDFKNRFNLRAPANIQIVGPLFNVEKR